MGFIGQEKLNKWLKRKSADENKKIIYGLKISKRKWFSELLSLSPTEKVIYVGLQLYADKTGHCWPSMRKLAKDLGLTKNTIQKHIQTLGKKGFLKIEIKKGTQGKRFEYWLLK